MATARDWRVTVRPVVERVMRDRAVPGMVIAVARGEGRPEHLVVGADHQGRPLAEDSLLPIASITKLATALAVLRLVDRGALALDDPLARHLPDPPRHGRASPCARSCATPPGCRTTSHPSWPRTGPRWTGRRSPAPAWERRRSRRPGRG